ncbi:MAG: FCD domain-containing protein [Burkholderiaceae bacterium]
MPIQAVETQRLYRQISGQLRALILAGEFPVGSRLPAERDLSVQLGVSRPSLREALIALEVEGYIEVRMGSGIYVCEPPKAQPQTLDSATEEGPLELIRARALIEGEVAAVAARTGTKRQFDAIGEAIDSMEDDAKAGRKPLEADRLFHVRIAEASGNSVLVGVVRRLFDARLGTLFDQLHSHFETEEVWSQAIAEHREVLKALRSKNAAVARAAMQRHMEISYKRLTSSLTQAPKKGRAGAGKAARTKTAAGADVAEGAKVAKGGKRAALARAGSAANAKGNKTADGAARKTAPKTARKAAEPAVTPAKPRTAVRKTRP